jgi:steroid Delta-isomerase
MISQESIRAAITTYMAANNARDVEGFINIFAADASLYNVAETSPITGRDAVLQVAQQSLVPYQEVSAMIERFFIAGNGAAVFYTGHLTAQNGRTAPIEGIDVFEINDEGKIQSLRFYLDPTLVAALFHDDVASAKSPDML